MDPKNKLGAMPIRPLLYTMAVPLMLSLLIQSLYNIVDSIFVARLSETALTAASLVYAMPGKQNPGLHGGDGFYRRAVLSQAFAAVAAAVADKPAAAAKPPYIK